MTRPCFLVLDPEFAGSISTRKLIIETAKMNVISTYSGREAVETLLRFPALDGIVMDAHVSDIPCVELIQALKRLKPGLPVVVVGELETGPCPGADYSLDSFDPKRVLALLQTLVPEQTAAIEEQARELSRKLPGRS